MVQITDSASIALYNRGALTTLFQPEPSCYSTLTVPIEQLEYVTKLYVGHAFDGYFDTSCFPTGTMPYSAVAPASMWSLYYYSPAVCPSDWHTGTVLTSWVSKGTPTSMILSAGTSAIVCCPSGYYYLSFDHMCASTISKGQPVTYRVPARELDNWLPGTTVATMFTSETTVSADGVVVLWQNSDEALLAKATASPFGSPTPISATVTNGNFPLKTSTVQTASPSSSITQGTPLSTRAIVGLGVGIPVAIIAALILGVYVYRQKVKSAGTTSPPDTQAHEFKNELYGRPLNELYALSQPSELPSRQAVPSELPGRQAIPSELPSSQVVLSEMHEMH